MPDYSVRMDPDDEMVVFRNRGSIPAITNEAVESLTVAPLSPDAYEAARESAPGWDVYHLEQEWRGWMTEAPRNADAAFVGFCRKWYEKRGSAG